MTQVALVFPGQGAQYVGMGKEFYEVSPEARTVFEKAETILSNGLLGVIFDGPSEKLTSTAYCQPGILTFSLAALAAFKAHPKFKNVQPVFAAGLSLGEYSALAAAEAISFEETLKVVETRARLMEEAARNSAGKMAAVIGLEKEKLLDICRLTGTEVANFNSPQQIVITGSADKVEAACEKIRAAGAKGVIPLEVSGAFHSSLMQPAAEEFQEVLHGVKIHPAQIPVVSNVDGQPCQAPEHIRRNLAQQITSSVQWMDSIRFIASQGVKDFIEIGPGKVLSGLIRRIDPNLKVYNIETPQDIEKQSLGAPDNS